MVGRRSGRHAALSTLVVGLGGGLDAVAAVATVSSLGLAGVPLALIFGRKLGIVLVPAMQAVGAFVLPAATAFGVATVLVGYDRTLARGAAALALGGSAYALWCRLRHRAEVAGLVAALVPRRP